MNDGIILTLAYPETIVSHADEWYSRFLRFFFIGNKKHVRAGHAALVLIDKSTGILEYHDFGRYVTTSSHGRVRGRETDFELNFPIQAKIEGDTIQNLEDILKFLATQPKLTHGEGHLYASVCSAIDYKKARTYINNEQSKGFVRYAAFVKEACNCARFVTDSLIASITNEKIKSKLIKSKGFTPSTIGNVVIADTEDFVYKVSETGEISEFKSTVAKENRRLFLDVLKGYRPSMVGGLEPKQNNVKVDHAQWLSGIGAGAWFEIHDLNCKVNYRYRRISPHGDIDCDGIYKITLEGFDINSAYEFVHYSNCKFFHIKQNDTTYKFEFQKHFSVN
ncbi:DUF6695 family protein [uncultured Psychroserpens sp.]|uniref:DUF6695 family protein n=1 Tax=uncultured Psychroserpens sp. TaxID=255436 RepID=UPI002623CE3F|nr:DUF6695 family protein [uncultured Psychroserpens sp.]